MLCQFYEKFPEGEDNCPFGHQMTAISRGVTLKELPSYHCTDYLIGYCINPLTVSNRPLSRCKDGLHLTSAQLSWDGKRLQEALANEILHVDSRLTEQEALLEELSAEYVANESSTSQEDPPTAPDSPICSICQTSETVTVFGILKDCEHTFCASCILHWHAEQANNSKNCPVCRVPFTRVLLYPKLPSSAHKAALFDLQSRCDLLAAGRRFEVNDLQEMMERLAVGDRNED